MSMLLNSSMLTFLCSAVAQRTYMAEQYIGYDTLEGATGHRDRVRKLQGQEFHHEKKYTLHRESYDS